MHSARACNGWDICLHKVVLSEKKMYIQRVRKVRIRECRKVPPLGNVSAFVTKETKTSNWQKPRGSTMWSNTQNSAIRHASVILMWASLWMGPSTRTPFVGAFFDGAGRPPHDARAMFVMHRLVGWFQVPRVSTSNETSRHSNRWDIGMFPFVWIRCDALKF